MTPVAPRALTLLVDTFEGGGSVIEDLLDPAHHDAFRVLKDCGALTAARDVPVVLCPWCGEQDIAPQQAGKALLGLCPDCGYVPITNAALHAWAADPDWLLARLRQAFGIAARQDSSELVPGTLWKVGDHKENRRSRRILLARQLADPGVHRSSLAALKDSIERDNAVIIGTTPRSAARIDAISSPYVHLTEIVHFRSGKLELDEARWEWCLKPAHLRTHEASPVFHENFRVAVIEGDACEFSAKQAAIFGYLYAAKGRKCHKDSIMGEVDSAQKNPVELFRHNSRQFEAFSKVVEWDDYGFYALKRF